MPLFHISGVQTILQHLVVGGRLVFLEGRFDAGEVARLLEAEHVTSWTAVPTMLAMVLDHPDTAQRDLSGVRSLAVGGAPIPPGLLDRAHSVFTGARRRIALSYGSTEAGGTVATGLRDGSGLMEPLATVDVAIDEPDDAGIGEVLVRSASVMERYLGVPDDEQPVAVDGWLHTGDLGELRDGALRITGRVKDIIIRGGENISAGAVEAALREHPRVADAAVVALEHPTWGEEVGAAVQLRAGTGVDAEELRAFVSTRLAHYAVPTRWWFVDRALPLTETGKVSKTIVRAGFPGDDPLGEFRAEVAAWLEQHCPPSMRHPVTGAADLVFGGRSGSFPSEDARRWLACMADRGWTAPTWQAEYGGAGLSRREAAVLAEELQRLGCRQPLVSVHGIGMIGPVLLEHGSEEQRRRLLPPTARGELRWCQGFSEPAVGSDLASVQTRAVRDGDEYVITGQKLWTSFASDSDWIFVLARTDPTAPKREGLGFFLVDLRTPGISVRPIALLSGESEFCEVFFDDVRIPAEDRVGQEGDGWRIARLVLKHERQMFGQGTGLMTQRLGTPDFVGLARTAGGCPEGPLPDSITRDAIASADITLDCIRAALWRTRRGRRNPAILRC